MGTIDVNRVDFLFEEIADFLISNGHLKHDYLKGLFVHILGSNDVKGKLNFIEWWFDCDLDKIELTNLELFVKENVKVINGIENANEFFTIDKEVEWFNACW